MNKDPQKPGHKAECRFCSHVAYGDTDINALKALGKHVTIHHPKEAARASRMNRFGAENIVPLDSHRD